MSTKDLKSEKKKLLCGTDPSNRPASNNNLPPTTLNVCRTCRTINPLFLWDRWSLKGSFAAACSVSSPACVEAHVVDSQKPIPVVVAVEKSEWSPVPKHTRLFAFFCFCLGFCVCTARGGGAASFNMLDDNQSSSQLLNELCW